MMLLLGIYVGLCYGAAILAFMFSPDRYWQTYLTVILAPIMIPVEILGVAYEIMKRKLK